jgi:hypothetical protein
MEWIAALVLVGLGSAFGARGWGRRQAGRQRRVEDLAAVRAVADEDVTFLGEQLQRLDAEVAGHPLDAAARADYQVALDAYEAAQRLVPRIEDPEEVSKVTDILSQGRYALACVQARVAGEPVPERRTPCFFNPQHGPSARDVVWTRSGRGTRTVPACAQDAARVERGERPDLRLIKVAGAQVPYWEAGEAFLPYSKGYFATAMLDVAARGAAVWPAGADQAAHLAHHNTAAHHGATHHGHHGMGGHHGGGGGDSSGSGGS